MAGPAGRRAVVQLRVGVSLACAPGSAHCPLLCQAPPRTGKCECAWRQLWALLRFRLLSHRLCAAARMSVDATQSCESFPKQRRI